LLKLPIFYRLIFMGYVYNFKDAIICEKWFLNSQNRAIADSQYRIMFEMLKAYPGQSILDIGCGLGNGLVFCHENGLQVTGLDPSPYMLDIAEKKIGNRLKLYRGKAEDLPFEDNSFNYASLINCLEFVDDPRKSLEEACRVAKDKIFIGIINRYALTRVKIRIKGLFADTEYNHAMFFSIWDLKKLIFDLLGDVPVQWQSVPLRALPAEKIKKRSDNMNLTKKYPFGAYIVMTVPLLPRFRTRPLELKICPKPNTEVVPGLTSNKNIISFPRRNKERPEEPTFNI
jgi:SAM-dependent methyltransferase